MLVIVSSYMLLCVISFPVFLFVICHYYVVVCCCLRFVHLLLLYPFIFGVVVAICRVVCVMIVTTIVCVYTVALMLTRVALLFGSYNVVLCYIVSCRYDVATIVIYRCVCVVTRHARWLLLSCTQFS